MCFQEVRRRFQDGRYTTVAQMAADIRLIATNAMTYNAPDTKYYRAAQRLLEVLEHARAVVSPLVGVPRRRSARHLLIFAGKLVLGPAAQADKTLEDAVLDPATEGLAFGPAAARRRPDAAARPVFLPLPTYTGHAADSSDGDGSTSDGSEADADAATPDDVEDDDDIDIGAHAHVTPRSPLAHQASTRRGTLVINGDDSH